jgi:hypothetical protein
MGESSLQAMTQCKQATLVQAQAEEITRQETSNGGSSADEVLDKLLPTSRKHRSHTLQVTFDSIPRYDLDYRNQNHHRLPVETCSHDHCHTHYSEKSPAQWATKQKQATEQCRNLWYECFCDTCEKHLWDKRERSFFPGHEDPAEHLRMKGVMNGVCGQMNWQTCLHEPCSAHFVNKARNGFSV